MSKEEDRSKSSMVRIALQEYLDDLYDAKVGEKAYKRWVEEGRKTISFEDIIKKDKIDLGD